MLPRMSFMANIGDETDHELSDIHSSDDYLIASDEEEKLTATKVRSSHEFIMPSRDARDLSPSPRHEGWNYERRCTRMHQRETQIVMEYPAGRKRSVSQVTPRSKLNFATTYTTELRLEHAKNREPLPSAVFRSKTQRFLHHASKSYTPTSWKSAESLTTTQYESIQRKGIAPSYLKRSPKVVANNLLWEQRIESVCSKKNALPWLVYAKEGRSIEKQIDMSPLILSEQQHSSTSSAAELCTEYVEDDETLPCCGIRSAIDLRCYSEESEVDQRVNSTTLMPEIIVRKNSDLNGPSPAEAFTTTADQYVEHLRDHPMLPPSVVRSTTTTHYREEPTMTLSKPSAGLTPRCSFYQKYLDEIAEIERKYPLVTAEWNSSHTTLKEGVQSSESVQPVEQDVDLCEEGSNPCSEESYMREVEYAGSEVSSINEFEETSMGQVTIMESEDGFSPICEKSPIRSEDEYESIRSGKGDILEQKSSSISDSIGPLFSGNEEEPKSFAKEEICQSRLSDREEKTPSEEPKVKPPTAEELEEIWRIILFPETIKSEQPNAHPITPKKTNLDEVEQQNAHPIKLKRRTNLDDEETYKAKKKLDHLEKLVDEIDNKIQYILWKDFKVELKNKRMDINKVARQVKQLTSDPRQHQHPLLSTPSTSRGKNSSLNPAPPAHPYPTGSDQTKRKQIKSYSGRIDFTLSDDYRQSYEIYARATSSRGSSSSNPAPVALPYLTGSDQMRKKVIRPNPTRFDFALSDHSRRSHEIYSRATSSRGSSSAYPAPVAPPYPTGSDQMRGKEIKPSPARFDLTLIDDSRRRYGIFSNSRDDILGQAILEEKMNELRYLQSIGRIPSMRDK